MLENEFFDAKPNRHLFLDNIGIAETKWVTKNTAVLVVHGMGFQLPLETIDQFGRGLVKQYKKVFDDDITLEHMIVGKQDNGDKSWFDNVLRIKNSNSDYHIDVYEYYWANYTEDKASWSDLSKWLQGVVRGAKMFYDENAEFGKIYKDKSIFFDKRTGAFKPWRYRFFLTGISKTFFIYDQIIKLLIWAFNLIPFGGRIAAGIIKSYTDSITQKLTNFLVDLVAYVVVDPKSKFYCVRSLVLEGAVHSIQYLLELVNDGQENALFSEMNEKHKSKAKSNRKFHFSYDAIVVASHSLGTQISHDAINRINLMINENKIKTYTDKGVSTQQMAVQKRVSDHLTGYVTFGSPLDKIVFFLREKIPHTYFLRQQLLDDFHGFKQRISDRLFNNPHTNKDYVEIGSGLQKFFEKVPWRNYYDDKDYISGGLDYYTGVININCQFKGGRFAFTHSDYWEYEKFYQDIIANFLK